MMQMQKRFFHPRFKPSVESVRAAVDFDSPSCPLYRYVGNDRAKRRLATIAFSALQQWNHDCSDIALAFIGPTGSGKTTLVRAFADLVELPFTELHPKSIQTLDSLVDQVARALDEAEIPLTEMEDGVFVLPPSIVFIDEVHALDDAIVQGLLKAVEPNDGTMVTESGRKLEWSNVLWIIATTDSGKLFDAFRNRFSLIELKYLNSKEIAEVIRRENEDWDDETCLRVARYNRRNARKALEFARWMRKNRAMYGGTWAETADRVAVEMGIDEYGMDEQHLKVLKALGQTPISKGRIGSVLDKKTEEMENYVMPWLLTGDDEQEPLVKVGPRGYCITQAGVEELSKRGIAFSTKAIK